MAKDVQPPQNILWLSTSLFCCIKNWNLLLRYGIKPFIVELSGKEDLASFRIELNYSNGDNIRLALLTIEEQAETLAKKIDSSFKAFFLYTMFEVEELSVVTKKVFMPFPVNTIQYGLYSIDSSTLLDTKICSLTKRLSLIIAEALGEETIDQETIITFAFYLHLSLLKLLVDKAPRIINDIFKCISSNDCNKIYQHNDRKFLNETYENNEIILREITGDIFNHRSIKNDLPSWFYNWIEVLKPELASYQNDDLIKLQSIYNSIRCLINSLLGITGDMKILLNMFIQKQLLHFYFNYK